MKTYYMVACNLIVEATDDDMAREIVYEISGDAGISAHVSQVTLYETNKENSND